MKKLFVGLFILAIANYGCDSPFQKQSSIEGLWFSCEFNGYNEGLFFGDSAIVFIEGGIPYFCKSVLDSNTLIFLNSGDTIFQGKVLFLTDSTFDLSYEKQLDHFYKIKQLSEIKISSHEDLYNDYVIRMSKSNCFPE